MRAWYGGSNTLGQRGRVCVRRPYAILPLPLTLCSPHGLSLQGHPMLTRATAATKAPWGHCAMRAWADKSPLCDLGKMGVPDCSGNQLICLQGPGRRVQCQLEGSDPQRAALPTDITSNSVGRRSGLPAALLLP